MYGVPLPLHPCVLYVRVCARETLGLYDLLCVHDVRTCVGVRSRGCAHDRTVRYLVARYCHRTTIQVV